MTALKEELLKKFSPDDSDSLGTQFFTDAQQRVQQSNSVDVSLQRKKFYVDILFYPHFLCLIILSPFVQLASIFDDDGPDLFRSISKHNEPSAMDISNLLSVNQLLESVSNF